MSDDQVAEILTLESHDGPDQTVNKEESSAAQKQPKNTEGEHE
jgi:hypothetical protein